MNKQLLQTAKPILFNTEMVKAILKGRKIQTRRVVNKKYLGMADIDDNNIYVPNEDGGYINILRTSWCKYKVGDILYVRETFYPLYNDKDSCVYKADYPLHWTAIDAVYGDVETDTETEKVTKWKPSIHMPKKYARIFLKVTNVRVERLQDVSYNDIYSEGCPRDINIISEDFENDEMLQWWASLWNSTTKDGYKWEDNPYVFVYEFEKVEVC